MRLRLIESSKVKKKKSLSGALASVALHSAILFLVIYATAHARTPEPTAPKAQKVTFTRPEPPPKEPEPPKQASTAPLRAALNPVPVPAPALGFKKIDIPVEIPTKIPEIDLTKAITNENDFTGKGVAGGIAKGVAGGSGGANARGTMAGGGQEGPYSEAQVDEPVSALPGVTPVYPEVMRSARVEGEVLVQFIVNEKGRVESGSIKIIRSSNNLFETAVRSALPRMKFKPAKVEGRPVRQLVQQPFYFQLDNA